MMAPRTFAPSSRVDDKRTRPAPAPAIGAERAFDPSGRGTLYWTSTARSALRPVLLHLRRTGDLPDKNAEMLVPRWVCTSLHNTVRKVCSPTIHDTASLRGVLVYHQYGFPQRLDRIAQRCRDRGLFLIENNVNCVFNGQRPGGLGEAGLAKSGITSGMIRLSIGIEDFEDIKADMELGFTAALNLG